MGQACPTAVPRPRRGGGERQGRLHGDHRAGAIDVLILCRSPAGRRRLHGTTGRGDRSRTVTRPPVIRWTCDPRGTGRSGVGDTRRSGPPWPDDGGDVDGIGFRVPLRHRGTSESGWEMRRRRFVTGVSADGDGRADARCAHFRRSGRGNDTRHPVPEADHHRLRAVSPGHHRLPRRTRDAHSHGHQRHELHVELEPPADGATDDVRLLGRFGVPTSDHALQQHEEAGELQGHPRRNGGQRARSRPRCPRRSRRGS